MRKLAEEQPQLVVKYSKGFQELIKWKTINDVLKQPPFVVVMWGTPGFGKTALATQRLGNLGDVFRVPPVIKEVWYDGYDRQRFVLYDEFCQKVPFHSFLSFLNGTELYPIKGSYVAMRPDVIVLTSMSNPAGWYSGVDHYELSGLERRLNVIYKCLGKYGDSSRTIECEKYTCDIRWPYDEKCEPKSWSGSPPPEGSPIPAAVDDADVRDVGADACPLVAHSEKVLKKKKKIEYNPFDDMDDDWLDHGFHREESDEGLSWDELERLAIDEDDTENPFSKSWFIDDEAEEGSEDETPTYHGFPHEDPVEIELSNDDAWVRPTTQQSDAKFDSNMFAADEAWRQATGANPPVKGFMANNPFGLN